MHLKSFAKGIMLEMYTTIDGIDYWAIEAHDVIVVKRDLHCPYHLNDSLRVIIGRCGLVWLSVIL